jgi:hypothetical protein
LDSADVKRAAGGVGDGGIVRKKRSGDGNGFGAGETDDAESAFTQRCGDGDNGVDGR